MSEGFEFNLNDEKLYLLTFDLAGHRLRFLHDTVDMSGHMSTECYIERPGSFRSNKPSDDFIASEQTKLLVELILQVVISAQMSQMG